MSHIDKNKLKDYFNGKLSSTERHEVEEWMIENPFEAEAYEGLQTIKNEQKLHTTVNQINRELRKYLQGKKTKRRSKLSVNDYWNYIAVLIVILLILITYFVIKFI